MKCIDELLHDLGIVQDKLRRIPHPSKVALTTSIGQKVLAERTELRREEIQIVKDIDSLRNA